MPCPAEPNDVLGIGHRKQGQGPWHAQADGVAVLGRIEHSIEPDLAAGPRTVFEHDVLPQDFAGLLRHDTRDVVRKAARRIRVDQQDGLGRESLGVGEGGTERQSRQGSTDEQSLQGRKKHGGSFRFQADMEGRRP